MNGMEKEKAAADDNIFSHGKNSGDNWEFCSGKSGGLLNDEDGGGETGKKELKNKALYRALAKTLGISLLISLVSGRYGAFAGVLTGIGFVLPVVLHCDGTSVAQMIKSSIKYGAPAALTGILVMLVFSIDGIYFLPLCALTGVACAAAYCMASKKIPQKYSGLIKGFLLIFVFMLCFSLF